MLLDATLLLADTTTVTTAAASTSYIDCQAKGNDYKGSIFVAQVETTAFTAHAGAPQAQFKLQTADDTSFATNLETLCQSSTYVAASLTVSKIICALPIPSGARRYIRGYYDIPNYAGGTVDFATCSYSMYIVHDADRLISGGQ